jgi:hypothetical protein
VAFNYIIFLDSDIMVLLHSSSILILIYISQ